MQKGKTYSKLLHFYLSCQESKAVFSSEIASLEQTAGGSFSVFWLIYAFSKFPSFISLHHLILVSPDIS